MMIEQEDAFEFTLSNQLTEEQWDMINDVDFDRTDRISFHTKNGKEVEFTKVIRCKDCKHRAVLCERSEGGFRLEFPDDECPFNCDDPYYAWRPEDNWYCPKGEKL